MDECLTHILIKVENGYELDNLEKSVCMYTFLAYRNSLVKDFSKVSKIIDVIADIQDIDRLERAFDHKTLSEAETKFAQELLKAWRKNRNESRAYEDI